VVGLAAAYYVAGRLGLLLAIPPGYATAVWPAAGIALAAVLLLGYRAWPGVLLGSFLVNVGTSLDPATAASVLKSLAVAASIGAGAAAQACAGAFLVRRFVGFPTSLDSEREVGGFLLMGALSCLVNATVGVSTLLVSGVISPQLLPFSWWTWWVGDTIGVIVFSPLVLIWAAGPRAAWDRRRASVTWPLAALSLLVVLLFVRASHWEQERVEREFNDDASQMTHGVERTLRQHLDHLESVHDFAASSPDFDRRAFRTFAAGTLSRDPGMHALSWNLRVLERDRAAVETAARTDGHPAFEIREQNAKGQLVRAGRRDEYVVVYYYEPHYRKQAPLGFDVAVEPVRRQALTLARDLDQAIATSSIRLVVDRSEGFLMLRPVYASGLPHGTVDERRRNLRGYVTAVVRIPDLIETPLRELKHEGIELRFYDETASGTRRLLYASPRPAGEMITPPDRGRGVQLGVTSTFELAGRRWTVRATPGAHFLAAHRAWHAWAVLAAGLLFTGLLGAFLLVITGRATKVELLVAQRTAELAESHQEVHQLASIVESSSDAIIGMTLEGTIVSWNAGAESTYGYTLEQVRNRHISLLHPPDGKKMGSEIFDRVLAGDRLTNLETVNVTKEGKLIEVSLTVSPIRDVTGRVIGAATIARDVTDRKALERMKAEFVGTVSHELRTPLAAIKGFVELVVDGEAGPVTDTQREFLEISARNADRLTTLINDLLDVNRMESSGLELREDPVDLGEVLGDVAATFRLSAEAKGLEFRAEPAELPRIVGDRDRLIQVFNNLVSNAIKYTPSGAVGMDARVREAEVEIVVHDSGIGLSPEEQARLFTKFFRGGHRIAREAGGTGLGLVIAKAIVERHRGRIVVESEPGAGTRFRVFLPLPSRASAAASAAA
jgi:PAS domain S-box-containing protein